MRDPAAGLSTRQLARIAGALYLINIVGGAFAIGYVNGTLLTDDLATTAHNIDSHLLLYRSGIAAHVIVTVTNVPLALIFYELFKVVNRRLALLDAFFVLVATAIEAASLPTLFAPLALLDGKEYANALPASQSNVLASLTGASSDGSYNVYTVFFGFDILCLAYLVIQSKFLPRIIGVLLGIDGAAYLVYSFFNILAPGFATHLVPWIQIPPPIAEGALSLGLLVMAVNMKRWNHAAEEASGIRSTHIEGPDESGLPKGASLAARPAQGLGPPAD
jgi:hypothetical protein